MADTIESFVTKLQQEGVEQGRQEARKLTAEAKQQADKLLADARKKAERIVADAQAEVEKAKARGEGELRLAARDAVLRLQSTLAAVLREVLARHVEQKLSDGDFLGGLIRDLAMRYAEADIAGGHAIHVRLPDEALQAFQDRAMQELARQAKEKGVDVDVGGGLAEAGFEYEITGGNVEVTASSVIQTLSELVGPRLREMVRQAAGQDAEAK